MRAQRLTALLAVLAFSACSGSGGTPLGAGPATTPNGRDTSAANGIAKIAISVPAAHSALAAGTHRPAHLRRNALPLETASVGMSVTAVNGTATQNPAVAYINLVASSSSCVPDPTGQAIVVCSVSVTAPAGSDTFAFTAYDDYDGAGTALAAGKTTATIPSGGTATVPVVLDGIVAGILVEVDTPSVTPGITQSVNVSAEALDPDGAAIIGTDPFTTPITLTTTDPQGLLTLGTTTVTSPATFVTGTFNATKAVSGSVSIGAQAQGIAASAVTPAVITITNDRNWTDGVTFDYAGSTTTHATATGYAPSTSTASLSSQESFVVDGPSIQRTVATTTTPTGGNPSTSTAVYGYYLDGQYTTTALEFSTFAETDVYGSKQQYQYTGDNTIDQFPETAGATFAESNAFDATFTATSSDPEPSQTYQQLSDGTYEYMDSFSNGDTSTSDDEAAPLPGATPATYQYVTASGTQLNYGFENPAGAGGGNGTIAISRTILAPSPSPNSSSSTAAPNWEPATIGFDAGTYQSDIWTQLGSVTIPAACGQATAYGTTANDLHEDYSSLDPVAGEVYVRSNDIYVRSGTGIVCRAYTTTANYYYNLNDAASASEPLATIFPGTLTYATTTTTMLGLLSIGRTSATQARISVANPRSVARKQLQRPRPGGGDAARGSIQPKHVEVIP